MNRTILSSNPFPPAVASRRPGVTMVELVATMVLLSVLGVGLMPLLAQLATAHRELILREWAVRELRNLAEIARIEPNPELVSLSPQAAELLSQPELRVARSTENGAGLERVTLSLSWLDTAGQRRAPVELIAFRPVNGSRGEGQP